MTTTVGRCTYGKLTVRWENPDAKLICGKFCAIGANAIVYLGGNHRTDWISTFPFGHRRVKQTRMPFDCFPGWPSPDIGTLTTKGSVTIGNDVWIADNVTIMSGVTIGDGAAIANNSHVVRDVEPYSIVGGNPAALIRYRFTKEQADLLLAIKWWDWSDAKIKANVHLLCSDNIDAFIQKHTKGE